MACVLLPYSNSVSTKLLKKGGSPDDATVDFDYVGPHKCPLPGTYKQLMRSSRRFMLEGDLLWSQACAKEAMQIFLGQTQPRPAAPLPAMRFKSVFSESSGVPEDTFDSLSALAKVWNKKTWDNYKLHLTHEPDDYYFKRRRPPPLQD